MKQKKTPVWDQLKITKSKQSPVCTALVEMSKSIEEYIKHVTASILISALEKKDIDINAIDIDGNTLLHHAARFNRFGVAKILLNAGININSIGGLELETPFLCAIRNKNYRLAELLYQRGADLNHRNVMGLDALHVAVKENMDANGVFILLSWGMNSNSIDPNGDTALTWLIENRQDEPKTLNLIRILLKYDTDHNTFLGRRADGNSPLHLFAKNPEMNCLAAFDVYRHRIVSDVATSARDQISQDFYVGKTNSEEKTPYMYARHLDRRMMLSLLWDAMFFTKLPYWFPAYSSAGSVFFIYIILNIVSPVYAIIVTILIATFLVRNVLQLTIIRHRGRSAVGFYAGLLACSFLYFVQFVSMFVSYTSNIFVILIFISTVLLSLKLFNTKAEYLKPTDRAELAAAVVHTAVSEEPDQVTADEFSRSLKREVIPNVPKLCGTCIVDSRYASMHCEDCGRCIVGMALHFPHLNLCIGQGNRRLYCCLLSVLSLYFGTVAYLAYWTHANEDVYCNNNRVSTTLWFGFYQFAVEFCMLTEYFNNFTCMLTILICWAHFLIMLYMELMLVSRESTLHMLSMRLFEYEEVSRERLWQNLSVFLRTGSYRVTYKHVSVQYSDEMNQGMQDSPDFSSHQKTAFGAGRDLECSKEHLLRTNDRSVHTNALRLHYICEQAAIEIARQDVELHARQMECRQGHDGHSNCQHSKTPLSVPVDRASMHPTFFSGIDADARGM